MYKETVENLSHSSEAKVSMFKRSKFQYVVGCSMAGVFIGFGIFIMGLSISIFGRYENGVANLINGIVFTCALSFVMLAGGDLFTGNILVLSQGALQKKNSFYETILVCMFSWIGNLIGAIILSFLFFETHVAGTPIGEALIGLAIKKASYPFVTIFFKGILCNVLVCVAVVCCYKLKSESGKLIMIFWCILPFIALGFEHSIANMTVFSLGIMLSKEITFAMAIGNLIPATLGNIVGGLIVSLSYYVLAKD